MRRLAPLVLAVACACVGSSSASRSPTTPALTSPAPSAPAFVRSCDSSVAGSFSAGWRKDSIVVGPVIFASAKPYAAIRPTSLDAPAGVGTLQKMLAVVKGHQPVTVSLVDASADARLAYDPAGWGSGGRPAMTTGQPAVVFEPCGDRASTQFNGAFLVRGAQCVAIEVAPEGSTPIPGSVSFGAGPC